MSIKNGTVKRSCLVRWNRFYVRSEVQQDLTNLSVTFAAGKMKSSFSRIIFSVNLNGRLIQKNFNDLFMSSTRRQVKWGVPIFPSQGGISASWQKNIDNGGETIESNTNKRTWLNQQLEYNHSIKCLKELIKQNIEKCTPLFPKHVLGHVSFCCVYIVVLERSQNLFFFARERSARR